MSGALRAWRTIAVLLLTGWLLGCASPRGPSPPVSEAQAHWQGRLAVKVFGNPVQAFAANFELLGAPAQGELLLTSPFGTTLAQMRWDPASVTLLSNGQVQTFDSLQDLALRVTGAALPVASLFAWLQGREEVAEGWQVDLSEWADGRLQARHVEAVQAELKIILDR